MGLILYLISYIIELPVVLINFLTVLWVNRHKKSFVKNVNGFFFNGAVSRDKFSNYNYRTGLNFWLVKETYKLLDISGNRVYKVSPYPFGNPKETISSALGKNQKLNTLTCIGWLVVYILWIIDIKYWKKGGHCINSIDETIENK